MTKNILILLLFAFLFFPTTTFAQEIITTGSLSNNGIVATQSAQADQPDDDYALPYPGILPDSALYVIKVARDGMVGMLITSPEKKASFDILQADKRLAAGKSLIEKDKQKYQLAETTISKGENYMEEAVIKTKEAKDEGLETGELESTLIRSLRKHKKIIIGLLASAPKDHHKEFSTLLQRITSYEKSANSFISLKQSK